MSLGAAFVRVSTGSQDETSQVKIVSDYAAEHGILIVRTFRLHGYSASHGMQEPALREAIADIQRGDYATLVVTESSRLDRREDLDAQAEILLAIRSAGGDIISISEPQFGRTDFAGRIVTLVAQHANAEKSRTVRETTYRGISMIIANKAHLGALPAFWAVTGERYRKQASCTDPARVTDIYERVAGGESLARVGRAHNLYPTSVKKLIRFEANHTGVIECHYTYQGATQSWAHRTEPVVGSPLWWRASKALDANLTPARANKGGRPVSQPTYWISGILDCPGCGGKVYLTGGSTPAGSPRGPKLRCGGSRKQRLTCGIFTGCDAQPVIEMIETMFGSDTTPVLAFQRVAGNAHELEALKAALARVQGQLSATEDDDALDALIAERKDIKARIEGFVTVPDDFDYAPAGKTVSDMWNSGDTVKRSMVRAVKESWGMILADHEGQWVIDTGAKGSKGAGDASGIVDLGNGLCFRRSAGSA